jgi:hypothetical protein
MVGKFCCALGPPAAFSHLYGQRHYGVPSASLAHCKKRASGTPSGLRFMPHELSKSKLCVAAVCVTASFWFMIPYGWQMLTRSVAHKMHLTAVMHDCKWSCMP